MKKLEVGDRIRMKNWANDMIVEIVRVTEYAAIAKTPYNTEMKFRRKVSVSPQLSGKHKMSTTSYTLLKPKP